MNNSSVNFIKNKANWLFLLISLLLSVSPDISFPQPRLDIPTANLSVQNPVPFHLIEKIARVKSSEKWGHGALGNPIPLCDLNGNITAYMFSFHPGKDRFPTYDEILRRIKVGRELRGYLKELQFEKARELHKMLQKGRVDTEKPSPSIDTQSISDPQVMQLPSTRPDGSMSRRFEVGETREMEKFAAKRAIGADEFGTIVISATYNTVPVPVYFHYLAPYYTHFDLALENAAQSVGKDAFLRRVYFLGLKGQYFEFGNPDNESILVNAISLQRKDTIELQRLKGRPTPQSPLPQEGKAKMRDEIAKNWEKIKDEVGEK